jgi:hypothetical protein
VQAAGKAVVVGGLPEIASQGESHRVLSHVRMRRLLLEGTSRILLFSFIGYD